jgi:hypothetical protein
MHVLFCNFYYDLVTVCTRLPHFVKGIEWMRDLAKPVSRTRRHRGLWVHRDGRAREYLTEREVDLACTRFRGHHPKMIAGAFRTPSGYMAD